MLNVFEGRARLLYLKEDQKQGMKNNYLKWWFHLGIWLFFLFMYILAFIPFFSFELSLLRGLANIIPMAFLFYLNLYFVNRYLEGRKYFFFWVFNIGILLALSVLRVQLNLQFPEITKEQIITNMKDGWRFGAIATNILVILISTFYQMLENRYAADYRNQLVIQEQQEAQLQFLRAQINPHFLFNTLNNIYSLAVVQSEKTADMVLRLSNLLRYVVYDGREAQVLLSREVQQIKEYIELFEMRSEEPLEISFEIKGELEKVVLEPMILIPLVENCFKHCDFNSNVQAFIRLQLEVQESHFSFRTYNSKNSQLEKDRIGGVGLSNINRRLKLKYPERFELKTNAGDDTFEVILKLAY